MSSMLRREFCLSQLEKAVLKKNNKIKASQKPHSDCTHVILEDLVFPNETVRKKIQVKLDVSSLRFV